MARTEKKLKAERKFGIAEWYGRPFLGLSPTERLSFEKVYDAPRSTWPVCPFQGTADKPDLCTKKGGICSIRRYERAEDGSAKLLGGARGMIHTICPIRFLSSRLIYQWASEAVLRTDRPLVLDEIRFLERPAAPDSRSGKARPVGKIDNVLVAPDPDRFDWCALEVQARYLSGSKTEEAVKEAGGLSAGAPFVSSLGHPDSRSSTVKRLMPQLLIKVPTISRWGKKTVVVVDEALFGELGEIKAQTDLSNADLVWLVVGYDENDDGPLLVKRFIRFTELKDSIAGLTAGTPPSQESFEAQIRRKLAEKYPTYASNASRAR